MKKILLLSSILLSITSCQDKVETNNSLDNNLAQKEEVQIETTPTYEEAKATLDELFHHAERFKKGEISKEKHDAISYPIGKEYRKQKAALSEEDKKRLTEYGLKRFDEVYPEEDRIEVNSYFSPL